MHSPEDFGTFEPIPRELKWKKLGIDKKIKAGKTYFSFHSEFCANLQYQTVQKGNKAIIKPGAESWDEKVCFEG